MYAEKLRVISNYIYGNVLQAGKAVMEIEFIRNEKHTSKGTSLLTFRNFPQNPTNPLKQLFQKSPFISASCMLKKFSKSHFSASFLNL